MRKVLLLAILLVSVYSADVLALEKGNPTGSYYYGDWFILIGDKEVAIDRDYIALFINGTLVTDYDVIIRSDRALVPIRLISQELGASVEWDASRQLISIKKGESKIELTIDSDTALVNNDETLMDYPAVLHNDSTYVPIRFIAEKLDATVSYAPSLRSEFVYYYDTLMPMSPANTIVRDFPNIIIDEKYDLSLAISKEEAEERTKEICLEGLKNFKKSMKESLIKSGVENDKFDNDFKSIEMEINRMIYLGEVSRYYKFTIGPYDIMYDKYNGKIYFVMYSSGIIVKEVDVYDKSLYMRVFIVG